MVIDKLLNCCSCTGGFVFSAGEQEFFAEKGLVNEPKRCPNCRVLVRAQRNGKDRSTLGEVSCAECGKPAIVPFQPKGYRPVYCADCLRSRKHPELVPV